MYRLDDPEDAEVPALENGKCWYAGKAEQTDCAPSVNMPPWPRQAGRWCNRRTGERRLPGPVLSRELAPTDQLTKAEVGYRIGEVAHRPGIGGYRKNAAALLADHDIDFMRVQARPPKPHQDAEPEGHAEHPQQFSAQQV